VTKPRVWPFYLYNALLLAALPLVALYIGVRWWKRILFKASDGWGERWGRLPPSTLQALTGNRVWWIHAVSMGEVKAIETFLRRLSTESDKVVLLSVVTPEALSFALEKKLAHQVIPAPIDLPWIVRRVFRQVRPELFISVESEFWPNLLREAKRAGARVALINGRLSARSFKSYCRLRIVLSSLWDCFDLFAIRDGQDAERFRALGVPPEKLHVTGNLKYDLSLSQRPGSAKDGSQPVIVMGSTREGEEKELLPVLERIREQHPGVRVIWAPRHVERVAEIERIFAAKGISYGRKSLLGAGANGPDAPFVLWDSMGDLIDAYRQADVAVIGGSFVAKGGQNPIEPAALQVPVVFGPSMDNFHAIAETLLQNGGARQVTLSELEGCLQELLGDPETRRVMGVKARQAVELAQGATERTLRLLNGLRHGA
jgi:3-deoxy-D-manno-octulosonic-acid transferase